MKSKIIKTSFVLISLILISSMFAFLVFAAPNQGLTDEETNQKVDIIFFDKIKAFFTGRSPEVVAQQRVLREIEQERINTDDIIDPYNSNDDSLNFEEEYGSGYFVGDSCCKVYICQSDSQEIHCTDTFEECMAEYEYCRPVDCNSMNLIPPDVCDDLHREPRPNECCCKVNSYNIRTGSTRTTFNDYGFIEISECTGDCLDRRYCLQQDGEICCQLSSGRYGWTSSDDTTDTCTIPVNDINCLNIGDDGHFEENPPATTPRESAIIDDSGLVPANNLIPTPEEDFSGIFAGLDDESLLLRSADCERNFAEGYLNHLRTIVRYCDVLNVTNYRTQTEVVMNNCVGFIHECDYKILFSDDLVSTHLICEGIETLERQFEIPDCEPEESESILRSDAHDYATNIYEYGVPSDCRASRTIESDDGHIRIYLDCSEHENIEDCFVQVRQTFDEEETLEDFDITVLCGGESVDDDFWDLHRISSLSVKNPDDTTASKYVDTNILNSSEDTTTTEPILQKTGPNTLQPMPIVKSTKTLN